MNNKAATRARLLWASKLSNRLQSVAKAIFSFQCVNGTYSEETCENGLVYGEGHGAAHNFCNYNWEVDCGTRAYDDTPISSPGEKKAIFKHLRSLNMDRYQF